MPSNFPSIEGWLPGEYRFPKDTDIKKVIQTMADKTKADLKEAGVSGDQKIFEVLTHCLYRGTGGSAEGLRGGCGHH